jgi:hypothetical protein
MQDNGGSTKIKWTINEVLTAATETFAANWKPLLLAQLVLMACLIVPFIMWGLTVGGVALLGHKALAAHSGAFAAGTLLTGGLSTLGGLILLLMVGPSALRMVVAAARGQRPQVGDLFSRPFARAGTLTAAMFLLVLATMGGTMLFLIPGLIVAAGAVQTFNLIIEDEQLGALGALRASWNLMRGHKLHYFGLAVVVTLCAGLISFVLGLSKLLFPLYLGFQLASTSFGWVMGATLYTRLRPLPTPVGALQPLLSATA